MTIQRYEIFNMTVRLGNITRASEALNMTQSGVSHALKSLEDEFDVKLLNRNKNGLNLTSEGTVVHEHTLRIVQANNTLLEEISTLKGVEKGRIRVGSFASVTTQWMPKILNYFKENYPNISIEIFEDDYESLERLVLAGELDCCFTSQAHDQNLNFKPLIKDTLYCIVSSENSLAENEFII